jgi:hypothetical protein
MKKLIALLITIFPFFTLAIVVLSLISVRSWILDRQFYENLLDDERLYSALLLPEELPVRFNQQVFTEADSLPVGALSEALKTVVTPEYLRTQSLSVVDQIFDFIEGRSNDVQLYLDLTPIKSALAGDGGAQFAQRLAETLPVCATGQDAIASGGSVIRCLDPDVTVSKAAAQIESALPGLIERAPDSLQINSYNYRNDWGWRGLDAFFGVAVRRGIDFGLVSLALSTVVFWLVAAYLGADSQRGRFLWLGTALAVPAGLTFIIGLALNGAFVSGLIRFGLDEARWDGVQYSPEFRDAIINLTAPLVNQIGSGFLVTGVVACLIALALWVTGLMTRDDHPVIVTVPAPQGRT